MPPTAIRCTPNQYRMKLIAIASILLLASCGPSENEKIALLQAQKAKDDSIRTADIQRLKDAELFRAALSDSLTAYTTILTRQQNELTHLNAVIYAANDEMAEIKNSGRETQVRNQELKVQSLLVQQISLQASVQHSQVEINQIKKQLAAARR